jgi:hypothetical protein
MDRTKLKALANAYRKTFSGPVGEQVLEDLKQYGFENETTFNTDERLHAVREGRRQYWLHIKQMLSVDVNKLGNPQTEGETNE